MSDTTAKHVEVSLPPDDGALGRAFAELDRKLAAWSSAVREVQTALTGIAARAIPAESAVADEGVQPAEDGAVTVDAEPCDAGRDFAEDPEPTSASVGAEPAVAPPAEPAADTFGDRTSEEPAADLAGEQEVDPPAEANDEALLASLDPEARQTIRVMRRLDPEQRSLRELIEEYQANQSRPRSAQSKKKSWWSRG